MSALLGTALIYHQNHHPHFDSLREQNRLLIYRCFNVLNREVELSGPQVMSYLMGWGDRFTSHQYVSVYWCQLARALQHVFPSLLGDNEKEDEVSISIIILFTSSFPSSSFDLFSNFQIYEIEDIDYSTRVPITK
jgi:hypothetical protein